MGVISNSEIAIKYRVSKPSVTFWVRDAISKKNNLILEQTNNKFRVVDNEHNHNELLRLAEEGRKYRRNIFQADITPTPDFYNVFTENEIVEIARDLEVYKEINFKFSYKNTGAKAWDDFYNKSVEDKSYKTHIRVMNLLENSFDIILSKVNKDKKLNIIDIGSGNSHPVKQFLEKLNNLDRLNKYVALDISPELIEISKSNINSWFPNLKFSSHVCDIEITKLLNIFEKERSEDENTVNCILDLGSTIGNHRNRLEVLRNISEGMLRGDLFIISNSTDLANNKSAISHLKIKESLDQAVWIPKMMGFDTDSSEVENRFDFERDSKIKAIRLDKDYTLKLKVLNRNKMFKFHKGDEILLWKHHMTSPEDLFSELEVCGLRMVLFNVERDYSHILMVSEINPID